MHCYRRIYLCILCIMESFFIDPCCRSNQGWSWITITTKQTERKNKNYAETGGIVYTSISSIRTVFALNASEIMIEKFKSATQRAYDAAIAFNALIGLANGSMMGSFLLNYVVMVSIKVFVGLYILT